nr:GTP-binding protein [Cryptomonas curvata]
MLTVNKQGDLQISSKWVETLASNSDKEKKKQLFFFSHIGSIKSNIDNFLKTITNDNVFSKLPQEIKSFYDISNPQHVHLSFCYDSLSLELLQNLKFMFLLSGCFIIHLNTPESKFYDDESIFIIQSLFFYVLSEIKTNKVNKTSIVFLTNQNNKEIILDDNSLIEIEKLWRNCLQINKMSEYIHLKDYFNFNLFSINNSNFENVKNFLINNNKTEKTFDNISYNSTFIQEMLNKKWIDSKYIPKNLLISIEDKILKETISLYFADSAFYEVLHFSQKILKKWEKIVYKGKTINDYGNLVSNFLENINKKFEHSIPNQYISNHAILKKKLKLDNTIQQRISYLFTKQLLNLQSQALDKFKDNLLKIASDSKKNFESEKKIAVESVNQWFISNANILLSQNINLSYIAAQKELNNVLIEFSEKFKESPIVKIQSLRRLEKQTSTSGLKQSGIVIGFGLTAAVRPNGFGNFQLITSYTQGPHVFNFSLVNDRDIAEQEGQGKIKPFRIQPSLNFDIEL